jgi:ribosomal-protein-alanine N-acetyltransferase
MRKEGRKGGEPEATVRGESDGAVLAALHAACFDDGWTAEAFATLLASPGCFALVADLPDPATEGGAAAGMILARIAGDDCEVITLGVAPCHRRLGLATLLVEHAAIRAAALGAGRQVLEVGTENVPARRLYARLGFAERGARPGYYGKSGGDAVILARDITPNEGNATRVNKVN